MASSSKQGVVSSDPQWRLDSKDLPVLRRIGRGLSGFVYETIWSGNRYTRKDFPLGSVKHKTYAFEKEVKPLFSLDHPNIVKCIGYTVGRSCCSLLQEYVNDNLQNVIQRSIEAQRTGALHSRALDVDKMHSRALHSRALDVDEMQRLLTRKVKERGITGDLEGSSTTPPKYSYGLPLLLMEVKEIMSAIAFGMKYLHERGVVHGDLKPKNVLLSLAPKPKGLAPTDRWNVKVADFGLIETKKRTKLDSKRSRHLETLAWKAPERLEELLGPLTEDSDDPFTDSDSDFDESEETGGSTEFLKSRLAMADVYSFGVTCAHMLGGKLLFPELTLTQLREQRSSRNSFNPELPSACPSALRNLIYSCMQFEPSSRPTFSEIRVVLYCQTFTEDLPEGTDDLLTTMRLPSSSSLGELSSEIVNMKSLRFLSVGKCDGLEQLPIGKLTTLTTLSLGKSMGNREDRSELKVLPSDIGNLTALATLSLQNLSLEKLPNEIGKLMALTTLSLQGCVWLRVLPSEIGNLTALTTLKLDGCPRLERLPSEISNLTALTTLSLQDCSWLRVLPSEICNLTTLTTLSLQGCSWIRVLPNEIGNLTALRMLNLKGCLKLKELPNEIGNLTALRELDLYSCSGLEQLPSEIGNLRALTTLTLDGCWKEIPLEIGNLTSLTTLRLNACFSLEELPIEIDNLMALTTLSLQSCRRLKKLPSEIGNLMALMTLSLYNCSSLEELPSEIGNLTALTALTLSSCSGLKQLPPEIGNLTGLKTLSLFNCTSLDKLPVEIDKLTDLSILGRDRS